MFLIKRKKQTRGFTLIELLIVIVIIATLAVTVFVALNPAQRLKDTRDARRTSDAQSILTAIHQAIVDSRGSYPSNMPTVADGPKQLGTGDTAILCPALAGGGNCTTTAICANLMADVAVDLIPYLKSMPIDPTGGTTYTAVKTGYTVIRDANGIVTVSACGTEGATVISASR